MKALNLKNICLLLFLSILGIYPMWGQTSPEEIAQNPAKSGGVYFAYPTPDSIMNTNPPKGYQPFYISHFGRHGSRYLISDNDYKWVLDLFENAHKNDALSPLGVDVYNRLRKVWLEVEGHGGDLSPVGVRQQRGIAERMYLAYPEVFSNNVQISARSTTVVRCILSMDAFSERLKELNPTLQINREASNKYMAYLNYHTKEAVEFRSSPNTWREQYRKFEEKHIQPWRLVNTLFTDSTFILKKVNPKALMLGLYEIAVGMQNIETDISFFDLFRKEELFDLWQCRNYRIYVEYANATENGGIMMENAKPVLKDILDNANRVIQENGKEATLRFAHDGNIVPLAMLLHLQDCYNSESEPSRFYKAWSDFKVAPMAGNIQIIFFRKNKSDDVIVKFLMNEKEILIPPVKSDILPFYHWKDIKAFYKSLLER